MKLEVCDGWLNGALRVESPNCDERPEGVIVSLLVIHNISLPPGQFGGDNIESLFCNQLDASRHPYFETICDLRVSAHLLIDREGAITQFVPFHRRAWHAGVSCFDGVEKCNDFSIGIELEGTDDLPYTDRQYETLEQVTSAVCRTYPRITPQRITGHEHIAPGRKTDPGPAFDWQRYLSRLEID